jgi:hypothetical protein
MQISKLIVAFVAVYGGLGGILFDAVIPGTARQHLWNPAWPPHAKFHNAQTMLMGLCNAFATLILIRHHASNSSGIPGCRGLGCDLLRLHADRSRLSRHRLE